MTVGNKLKRKWKGTVMTYFKVLSQHLPGRTEENHDKSQSGQMTTKQRVLNLEPYEYKGGGDALRGKLFY
jgi:hypothetical protein